MAASVLDTLGHAIDALEAHGANYCVVGGIARGLLAESRGTTDVDFAVAVDSQDQIDALMRGLSASGFQIREVFLKTASQHVATVRMTWKDRPTRADLLFETSGIEREVVAGARPAEVMKGVIAPLISREDLIAMKLIAGRRTDMVDIEALLDVGPVRTARVNRLISMATSEKRDAAVARWADVLRARREWVPDLVPAPKSVLRRLQNLGKAPQKKPKK